MLRFSSTESAEAWYPSAEYRPLREHPINELTDGGRVMLLEQYDPSGMAG